MCEEGGGEGGGGGGLFSILCLFEVPFALLCPVQTSLL